MIFTMSFAMLSHFFPEGSEPAFYVPLFLSPLPTRPLSSVRDDKEVNEGSIVGYSDFHNLMGFTSKKMPNNIL
jgi:hypothetical protein